MTTQTFGTPTTEVAMTSDAARLCKFLSKYKAPDEKLYLQVLMSEDYHGFVLHLPVFLTDRRRSVLTFMVKKKLDLDLEFGYARDHTVVYVQYFARTVDSL